MRTNPPSASPRLNSGGLVVQPVAGIGPARQADALDGVVAGQGVIDQASGPGSPASGNVWMMLAGRGRAFPSAACRRRKRRRRPARPRPGRATPAGRGRGRRPPGLSATTAWPAAGRRKRRAASNSLAPGARARAGGGESPHSLRAASASSARLGLLTLGFLPGGGGLGQGAAAERQQGGAQRAGGGLVVEQRPQLLVHLDQVGRGLRFAGRQLQFRRLERQGASAASIPAGNCGRCAGRRCD